MQEFKEEAKDLLKAVFPLEKMSRFFFPERFSVPFSGLHRQMIEAIESDAQLVCIAAPRGIGKTSLVGLGLAARAILYNLYHYILYVSNSETVAEEQTENLKMELMENEKVRKLYPPLTFSDAKAFGIDEKFSKKGWVAWGETMVVPRGSGQQVRGRLFRNSRPDLIIVDDLEDDETIGSEDVRRKRENWFFGSLMNCVSNTDRNWKIIYIDTLKHEDSLLAKLLELDRWKSLKLSICDDDYNSLAPEFISTEQLKQEVDMHRQAGTLDTFFRERRNIAISTEDASFRAENFRYYNETDLEFKNTIEPQLENLVLYDPAKTTKPQSAWTAIVGVGFHAKLGSIYVREISAGMMHPEQQYEEAFAMSQRIKARVIGLEVTGLNEFITYPFRTAMLQRGLNYEIIELKARKGEGQFSTGGRGKEGRIAALIPFYRKGQVFHNKANCGVLETQLLSYPRSKRWDVMDAFAYIVEILEMGLRYFKSEEEGRFATSAEVESEFKANSTYSEEDYQPLDYNLELV